MGDTSFFGPGIVIGGVRHMVTQVPAETDAHVDVYTEKLRRVREEEAAEEAARQARIEYTRHVQGIHSKRPCAEEAEEVVLDELDGDDMVLVEENILPPEPKRTRGAGGSADQNWYAESDGRSAFVPVMYTWQKDMESLRDLDDHNDYDTRQCFGCAFMSVSAHASIYADDWRAVVEFFQASMPMCPNAYQLGVELYEFFDKAVVSSMRARGVLAPDAKLWSPYGILHHFVVHTRDPVVQMMLDYMAYTEIHSIIINNEIFEQNVNSERKRTNSDALKKLKIITEMRDRVMRTNPHQLPHASKDVARDGASTVILPFSHPHSQMKQKPQLAGPQTRWDS